MHKAQKFFIPIFLLMFICQGSAFSQDTLVENLKEITITATRTEKNIFNTGRSVTVLTSEDIRNGIYLSLAEILSLEGGIYIVGSGQTPGSNQSLFLQGANSNQTAIFIDGVRISDASSVNNTIDLSELPLNNIQRIEILRGSHSTLYGSSAIGGVINIFTKGSDKTGMNLDAAVSSGYFGKSTSAINPSANLNYSFKNGIILEAKLDYIHVNGLDATMDTITDPNVYNQRDQDDWKKLNSGYSFGLKRKKTDLLISYGFTNMETDIDKSAFTDDNNYTLDYKRNTLSGHFNYKIGANSQLSLTGGYSSNSRHAVNDSSVVSRASDYDHQFTEDRYKSLSSNLDLIFRKKFKEHEFLFGGASSSEEMTSQNYVYSAFYMDPYPPFIYESNTELNNPKPHSRTNSIYAQLDLKGNLFASVLKNLNLVIGGRYDKHSIFHDQFSCEINPSYTIREKSTIYFSYSTGFNSPSLYELYAQSSYIPWDGSAPAGITLGNQKLKPEKSKSSEIGWKQKIGRDAYLELALYLRSGKNQIEYAYLWNKNIPSDSLGSDWNRDDYRGDTYINAGKSTCYGLNLSFSFSPLKKLRVRSILSIVDGTVDYSTAEVSPELLESVNIQMYNSGVFPGDLSTAQKGLIRRPSTAKIEINFNALKNLSLFLSGKYIDVRHDVYYDTQIKPQGALNTTKLGDYSLFDFTSRYQTGEHLFVSAGISNILDRKYSEIRGFTTRGRSYYLALRYSI